MHCPDDVPPRMRACEDCSFSANQLHVFVSGPACLNFARRGCECCLRCGGRPDIRSRPTPQKTFQYVQKRQTFRNPSSMPVMRSDVHMCRWTDVYTRQQSMATIVNPKPSPGRAVIAGIVQISMCLLQEAGHLVKSGQFVGFQCHATTSVRSVRPEKVDR